MADNTSFICGDHSLISLLTDGTVSLWDLSTATPYHTTFLTCHAFALFCFVVSSVTGNYSQVDKLWSILPALYAWMCVVDDRTTLMACFVTLWSCRLTYNFYRRGGYTFPPWRGEEDYRWECIRRGKLGGWWTILTNKWIMILFNFFFISLYQNWLLLWIASPSLVAWSMAMEARLCDKGVGATPLNILDGIAAFLFVSAIVIEAVADNQQYIFQTRKYEWKATLQQPEGSFANAVRSIISKSTEKEFTDGFCQSGLFAIVRKPNYAAEQLVWISFYLFSVAASASPSLHLWNWSGCGFVLLCMLFQGSGWLTEQLSIQKYGSKYREYQTRVPLYVPRIFGRQNETRDNTSLQSSFNH